MEIEYLEDDHIYLVDGVITPSVTQIINKIFPNTYHNVPESSLRKASEFGTSVHKMIENYVLCNEQKLTPLLSELLDSFIDIVGDYQIEIIDTEQIVNYGYEYAGRYDILARVRGKLAIIDIKATSQILYDHLEWQLGMYKTALESNTHIKIDETYCLWLPKKNAPAFVKIEHKSKDEIDRMLDTI